MLPEAFQERMQQMLGKEYEAFAEAFEGERCQALRLNVLKKGIDGRSAAEKYGARSSDDTFEKHNAGNIGNVPEKHNMGNIGNTSEKYNAGNIGNASEKHNAGDSEDRMVQCVEGNAGVGEKCGMAQESSGTDFAHLTKVPWAENGYYYQPEDQPGKHPFHEAGVYYIQEPSAMAPAELLDVKPRERVLDLCAAPGGKSTQIAAKLRGQGILVCNEIHPARAKILSENIERMGICNACVTNEAPERLADFFPGYFDKVLVDAPCSGEGMFRKNEAACDEWSPENVKLCAQRQDGILDQAARMLRPGGKLVYSTCTFASEEDEGSVVRFLGRHREFTILPIEKERIGLAGCDGSAEYLECGISGDAAAGSEASEFHLERTLRMWPQRIRGEGHFAALLQKDGDLCAEIRYEGTVGAESGAEKPKSLIRCGETEKPSRNSKRPAKGVQREQDKELEDLFSFWKENIRISKSFQRTGEYSFFSEIGRVVGMGEGVRPIRFGDNIYLVSADMPSLRGLKVLRPGLHLGELKKNRFEPSHALALALPPEFAVHVWNLDSHDSIVSAWLKGQTFPAEGEKGWYLICVDGFSVGWGKLAGGIMKNHYPIGLRRKDFKEF